MRGEDCCDQSAESNANGSPPHARGRPYVSKVESKNLGITPACAGKTDAGDVKIRATKDHPRMRGEDRVG